MAFVRVCATGRGLSSEWSDLGVSPSESTRRNLVGTGRCGAGRCADFCAAPKTNAEGADSGWWFPAVATCDFVDFPF